MTSRYNLRSGRSTPSPPPLVPPPPIPSYVLVFDTETTGVLPKVDFRGTRAPLHRYPHMLQLSFLLYDPIQQQVVQDFNEYIAVDASVAITEEVTAIHGITREMCETRGVPAAQALCAFHDAYQRATTVVAHNLSFDREMVLTELARNYHGMVAQGCTTACDVFNPMYELATGKVHYCTMHAGKSRTNLWVESTYVDRRLREDEKDVWMEVDGVPQKRRFYNKYPKLIELYRTLFDGREPVGALHDARVDTHACLECYLELTRTPIME